MLNTQFGLEDQESVDVAPKLTRLAPNRPSMREKRSQRYVEIESGDTWRRYESEMTEVESSGSAIYRGFGDHIYYKWILLTQLVPFPWMYRERNLRIPRKW